MEIFQIIKNGFHESIKNPSKIIFVTGTQLFAKIARRNLHEIDKEIEFNIKSPKSFVQSIFLSLYGCFSVTLLIKYILKVYNL